MKLRRQLLLVSLLLISLPWAGCQYVREVEKALQTGQEQSLLASSAALAMVLSDKPELLYPNLARLDSGDSSGTLYAEAATAPIIVDGYADGWEGPVQDQFGPVGYRARVRGPLLYLLLTVSDDDVRYQDPRQPLRPSGDHLVLRTGGLREYRIATAAPGPVQALGEPRIRGFWQDSLDGYSIELQIPLSLIDERLGFYLVDRDSEGVATHGNIQAAQRDVPWLVYPPLRLQALLEPFSDGGIELRVIDADGWRITTTGSLENSASSDEANWLLRAIYRAILNAEPLPATDEQLLIEALAGQSGTQWYSVPDQPTLKLLSAATPIPYDGGVMGAIVARQNSEEYLGLTDHAFNRLLYFSSIALAFTAAGLLGYASLLSWRIRRLSRATSEVVNSDGSLRADFPVSAAADEIGDLSRQYAELLDRLREYTDYLRTLSHKLSHELRTPIAVIRSSLDNLEEEPAQSALYLERAREGLSRLSNILTAMSEATRLEESVHKSKRERFDLALVCRDLGAAYREVYTHCRFSLEINADTLPIEGVPDLLAQLLDKLVDNAASFTPAGGTIRIRLSSSGLLEVINEGPPLPEAMQGQLFDSLVSVRERGDHMHLGLGLHIVKLIADFHGMQVAAENLADGSGVRVSVQAHPCAPE